MVRDALVQGIAPLYSRLYRGSPRIRVISLHDVAPVHYDTCRERIRWLAQTYRIVSLDQLYKKIGLDDNRLTVALTFDDGFKEHATFIVPLLRELSIPATFFIPSTVIGLTGEEAYAFAKNNLRRSGHFQFMNQNEVCEIAQDPLFEIGGHTAHHVDLGLVTDPIILSSEIMEDKFALEKMINKKLNYFAYPFGSIKNTSPAVITVLKEAGYQGAFTIMPSFWTHNKNPYLIGRDSLSFTQSESVWDGFLKGGYDLISRVKTRGVGGN